MKNLKKVSGPRLSWAPSATRIQNSNAARFINSINASKGSNLESFGDLYDYSIAQPAQFWAALCDFCEVNFSKRYDSVLENSQDMLSAVWFKGATLNFAENLLRTRTEKLALIFRGEDKIRREMSYAELYSAVAKFAYTLRAWGVAKGDVVAGMLPNMPEAVVAMLATTAIGAIWTSCSPDFGVPGVVDRFGQTDPKVFLFCDGYYFKGQKIDTLVKAREVKERVPSIRHAVVVEYAGSTHALTDTWEGARSFADCLNNSETEVKFEQLPFNHPLFILYSSGTTGKPKCIVHSAGGTLIEHLKELIIHTDLKPEDRFFFQTTCGWMMWPWLVSGLASNATLVLYDGSPLIGKGDFLWQMAEEEGITIFGTNPKFLALLEKEALSPGKQHNLSALQTILSTGSPLLPESFDYVYAHIKSDLMLSSIAGGTDIIGCFALGSPCLPVYRGELQTRSLGYKVEVFDEHGKSLRGEKGELVCTAPFPSMPLGFWKDDGTKYQKAYFARFPNVWHHGDWVMLSERGGLVYFGRSDAVLNPGGVRIGTAEIYRQVESLPEIVESLAVGQNWQSDVRVVLFVKLKDGINLDAALIDKVKTTIRKNASPFHVPAKIIAVPDLPRTRSGKLVELAVRDMIHGILPKNLDALANPETLELFRNLPDLAVP